MIPGAMALTRMLCWEHCGTIAFTNPNKVVLLTEYSDMNWKQRMQQHHIHIPNRGIS